MTSRTELENAVLTENLGPLELFLQTSDQLEAKDKFGRTIIFDAIVKGFVDVIKLLIRYNASINIHDKNGKTPLHFAAIHGRLEIAQILINEGATIDAIDSDGNTPLSDAIFYSNGFPDLILLLKNSGANPNFPNKYGVSPKKLADTISNFKVSHLLD